MDQRTRRSPARFLAPLALIVVLVAFLSIVSSGGGGSSTSSDTGRSTTQATTAKKAVSSSAKNKTSTTTVKKAGKRFYIVQTGDTLGAIADKSGIPLETIQSLNPDVDPHSMTTGQKIRLK